MGIDGILSQGNPSSFDSIESLNDFHQYDCYRRSTSSSLPELLHTTIITVQLSLETSINTQIPASSPAHALFLLSVSNTVAHLTSFLAFIDNSVNWWTAHGMDVSGAFTLAT